MIPCQCTAPGRARSAMGSICVCFRALGLLGTPPFGRDRRTGILATGRRRGGRQSADSHREAFFHGRSSFSPAPTAAPVDQEARRHCRRRSGTASPPGPRRRVPLPGLRRIAAGRSSIATEPPPIRRRPRGRGGRGRRRSRSASGRYSTHAVFACVSPDPKPGEPAAARSRGAIDAGHHRHFPAADFDRKRISPSCRRSPRSPRRSAPALAFGKAGRRRWRNGRNQRGRHHQRPMHRRRRTSHRRPTSRRRPARPAATSPKARRHHHRNRRRPSRRRPERT